jgi:hypothetical protein
MMLDIFGAFWEVYSRIKCVLRKLQLEKIEF